MSAATTVSSSSSEDESDVVPEEEEEERFFTAGCSLNLGKIPPPSFGSYNCLPPSCCHRSIFASISFGNALKLFFLIEEAPPSPPSEAPKFPTNEYQIISANTTSMLRDKNENRAINSLLPAEPDEAVTSARTRNDSSFV